MHSKFISGLMGVLLVVLCASPVLAQSDHSSAIPPRPVDINMDAVGKLYAKPGFAGLIMRPSFCLDGCDDIVFTFGLETGYKYAGFSLRYGYASNTHFLYPDFRGYYDFHVIRHLTITPMLEISPASWFQDGVKGFQMILRPGIRISYAPLPYMMLFLEPFLLDIGVFSKTWANGVSATSSKVTTRYNFGFGIQTRF